MNYTYIFLTCNTDLHNFRIKKKGKSAERWGGWDGGLVQDPGHCEGELVVIGG